MLGYSSYKFQSRIYPEVLPVFAFFHPSLVNHFVGFLNEFDLLDVEDVTYDVLRYRFSALCISPLDTDAVVDAEYYKL